MILLSLLITLLTAQVYDVDPRLEPYLNEYLEIMEENNIKIPQQVRIMVKVNSKALPRGAAGAAWGMFKPFMIMVAVDPNALFMSNSELKWLMFHELTHDIWDIRHESGLKLMKPTIPDYVTRYSLDDAVCELVEYIRNN